MIRPETGKDITDEEFIKVLKPFVDNYDEYLDSYILPEVISYYIANAYYRNAMYETTWIQEFNSARDIMNITEIDERKVSAEVKKLLRIKYALEVISDDPLDFKKIEY